MNKDNKVSNKSKFRLQQEANLIYTEVGMYFMQLIQDKFISEKFNELMQIKNEFNSIKENEMVSKDIKPTEVKETNE